MGYAYVISYDTGPSEDLWKLKPISMGCASSRLPVDRDGHETANGKDQAQEQGSQSSEDIIFPKKKHLAQRARRGSVSLPTDMHHELALYATPGFLAYTGVHS